MAITKYTKVSVLHDRYSGYEIGIEIKAENPGVAYDLFLEAMVTVENKLELLEAANEAEENAESISKENLEDSSSA